MKTLTALLLWVLSSFGGAAPSCELVDSEQTEMCTPAPPPPPESNPSTAVEGPSERPPYQRHTASQSGARISNGF